MNIATMVKDALIVEKLRVAIEVRQTHLFNNGLQKLVSKGKMSKEEAKQLRETWGKDRDSVTLMSKYGIALRDKDTDELRNRIKGVEDFVDGVVAELLKEHPAYPWFSLVKGIGGENIGKVVGLIDITRAPTISSLWMFAGTAPENGKTMKRVKGEKLRYNSQLKSMCWRLATSLKRAGGVFYDYYAKEKAKYTRRFEREGIKILPTPSGKWCCLNCGVSWEKKGDILECCTDQRVEKIVKEEPPGVIWLGHLDMMATRKMIKLFLASLWLVWREKEGLPLSKPYAIEKQGHTKMISPWEMVDREAKISK